MIKEYLMKRIKKEIPFGSVVKFAEVQIINPEISLMNSDALRFRLEIVLDEKVFTRSQAFSVYKKFRELLPESEETAYTEDVGYTYKITFNIIIPKDNSLSD